jgi:hypothetical protein
VIRDRAIYFTVKLGEEVPYSIVKGGPLFEQKGLNLFGVPGGDVIEGGFEL